MKKDSKSIKRIICRIEPIRCPRLLQMSPTGENQEVIDFIRGLGYLVYADPTDPDCNNVIIADRTMTFGDLKKKAKRFGINLRWWNDDTDYNDRLAAELHEA